MARPVIWIAHRLSDATAEISLLLMLGAVWRVGCWLMKQP